MAEINQLTPEQLEFLAPYLPPPASASISSNHDDTLPFVTLTYAQSMDGMIALPRASRTILSGPETKGMTHYLRTKHDAILVGAGTATADDPGLNSRYPDTALASQPRPIIVDPNGRWQFPESKMALLAISKQGKGPWIVRNTAAHATDLLLRVGGDVVVLPTQVTADHGPAPRPRHPIAWQTLLRALKQKGITSVMIEGGSKVITSLLSQPGLVDATIVTIAPTWLGQGSVAATPVAKASEETYERVNAATLQEVTWRQFGADAVMCGMFKC